MSGYRSPTSAQTCRAVPPLPARRGEGAAASHLPTASFRAFVQTPLRARARLAARREQRGRVSIVPTWTRSFEHAEARAALRLQLEPRSSAPRPLAQRLCPSKGKGLVRDARLSASGQTPRGRSSPGRGGAHLGRLAARPLGQCSRTPLPGRCAVRERETRWTATGEGC